MPRTQILRILAVTFLVGCMVAAANAAQIPVAEWGHQLGGTGDDGGMDVAVDGLGNVYASGYGFGAGFIGKYDSTGAQLWTQSFGSGHDEVGFGLAVDPSGNAFVTGITTGSYGGPYGGGWDGFVTKFNAAGSQQWVRQFGAGNAQDPYAIAADELGNAYVTGFTDGALGGPPAGGADTFLIKYDAAGNVAWTRQYGNEFHQTSTSVATDKMGAVYISGNTFGNLGGTSAGGSDAFVAKYDVAGNFQWVRQFGTSAYDDSWGVAADRFGNVYVAGDTEGTLGASSVGARDFFLAKYTSAGNLLWIQQWGTATDEADSHVSVDDFGNAYVSGLTWGSLTGGAGGSVDPFVTKFDPSGALIWSWQAGSDAIDGGRAVAADGVGNVYITGETRGGSFFGPNAGGDDLFLIKIAEVPEPSSAILTVVGLAVGCVYQRRRG